MGRAPCCDKANVKRGPWSPEEDAKLKSYIEKHGTGGNWIALPQKIGLKRCGKSCRLRWLNYLRPNIKHGGFTEDEDNLICSLYISIGSRWSIIAAQLPGRTDNDIKNYWNTRLKKKLLGRQRREQQARKEAKQHLIENKRGPQNCPINYEYLSLYPQPPPVAVPPLPPPADYSTLPAPPPIEPNFGNFCYTSDIDLHANNMMSGVSLANDFQAFEDIINHLTMPQQYLDGVECNFSAADMVGGCAVSSWSGDDHMSNCPVYPCALANNFEVCQKKMAQDWDFVDEPRSLGFFT